MEHHTVGGFRTFKKKKENRCFSLFMISWLIRIVDLITTMRVSQANRNHQSVRKFAEKESQKSCEASSSQWRSGARKGWMKSASQSWTWVSVDYPASGLTRSFLCFAGCLAPRKLLFEELASEKHKCFTWTCPRLKTCFSYYINDY